MIIKSPNAVVVHPGIASVVVILTSRTVKSARTVTNPLEKVANRTRTKIRSEYTDMALKPWVTNPGKFI